MVVGWLMSSETPAGGKWIPSLYFVIGQAGWFACVLTAAHGIAWVGMMLALVFMALHVLRVAGPREELKLLSTVMFMGWIWESVLVSAGLLAYPGGVPAAVVGVAPLGLAGVAPLWLPALWGMFAAQFNTTYRWLKTRIVAAALLGAVAGPLSFRSGAALGALRFAKPLPAAAALALGWAVLLPVIVLLSRRWDGVAHLPTSRPS